MLDPAESEGLVLDTSVLINLLATEAMAAILGALAVPCYAPEQVVAEVRRHPVTGMAFPADNHPLRETSSGVAILSLAGAELNLFLGIVGAPAGRCAWGRRGGGHRRGGIARVGSGHRRQKGPAHSARTLQPGANLLDRGPSASAPGGRCPWSLPGGRVFREGTALRAHACAAQLTDAWTAIRHD